MNKLLPALLLLCLGTGLNAQTNFYGRSRTFKLPANSSAASYLPKTVIVKMKSAESSSSAKTLSVLPVISLKSASVLSITQKFPAAGNGARSQGTLSKEADRTGLDRIYELKYSGSAGIEEVINELLSDKNVEYAEPSYIHHVTYEPEDPLYSGNQGYLAQVKAPEAWDIIRNSEGVVIGIVDSGSELTHEDLAPNIVGGWDLIGASADNFAEDDDPSVTRAESDHGVHVSGLASAASGNGKGIASIASNARLFIVKVAADNNGEDIYRGYDGIKYAADHGAAIINCSWGSTARSFYGEDVVNYAIGKGCLIVAAGGNNAWSTPDYPAGYKGVIAVANVRENDVKSSTSNYGGYISVSAPGTNIYSTTFHNTYGYKSGTSMASPVVAGAAALVKSYFPALSMQQVGELIRVTADNIDNANPSYAGKLGKGRLNVYRALTENSPAVRYQAVNFDDENNGSFSAGSTFSVYLDIKNFLLPVSGLQVSLKSDNPNVVVSSSVSTVATLGTLEEQAAIGPFTVQIKPGTPDNTPVEFEIDYAGNNNSYRDYETFTVTVARDYLNIVAGDISTTATSNGRVGYSSGNQDGGLGFQYKEKQLLYEASLMIGNVSTVSNNARTSNGSSDEHFIKRTAVKAARTDTTVSGSSEFDDSGNPASLGIDIRHQLTAPLDQEGKNYVIAEYEVVNRNANALKDLYIGLFNDWDIDAESSNATRYDALNRIAYAYSVSNSSAPYAGVKLLNTTEAPAYYPMTLSGAPLSDDNFSSGEKYLSLSSGVASSGAGNNTSGADISFVAGYGPFTIPANGSVKVAFAYGAGDNLSDLKKNLAAAQSSFDKRNQTIASSAVLYSYPNPVTPYYNNNVAAVVNLQEDAVISLDLFNLLGQKVRTLVNETSVNKGQHTLYYNFADLGSGIYIMRLRYNGAVKTHKISVVR